MRKGLISVIVPVYNAESYLEKCMVSITSQTYQNLEIILVDDGSPDTSPDLCDAWEERDSRVRVIHQKNKGVAAARNTGLDVADGEFVAFVDPDDYIDIKMLEIMVSKMKDSAVGIVECGYHEVLDDQSTVVQYKNRYTVKQDAIRQLLLWDGNIKSVLWNKLYRRDVIQGKHFCEDFRCGEDTPFNYYAIKDTEVYVQIPYPGYYYIRRDTSLVGSAFNRNKMHSLKAAKLLSAETVSDFPELTDAAECHLAVNAYILLRDLFMLHDWKIGYKDEYYELLRVLRNSVSFAVKKYLPTKTYLLLCLCKHCPGLYSWLWSARKKSSV